MAKSMFSADFANKLWTLNFVYRYSQSNPSYKSGNIWNFQIGIFRQVSIKFRHHSDISIRQSPINLLKVVNFLSDVF